MCSSETKDAEKMEGHPEKEKMKKKSTDENGSNPWFPGMWF